MGKFNLLLKSYAQLQLCSVPDMVDMFKHEGYVHSMIPYGGEKV